MSAMYATLHTSPSVLTGILEMNFILVYFLYSNFSLALFLVSPNPPYRFLPLPRPLGDVLFTSDLETNTTIVTCCKVLKTISEHLCQRLQEEMSCTSQRKKCTFLQTTLPSINKLLLTGICIFLRRKPHLCDTCMGAGFNSRVVQMGEVFAPMFCLYG